MQQLIKNLKELKQSHRLSSSTMAKILDIPTSSYRFYEKAVRIPPRILERTEFIFGIKIARRRSTDTKKKHIKNKICSLLKKLRIKKKMSVKWIAYKIGVSYSYYYRVEKGGEIPPRSFYKKFCKALGIPVKEIRVCPSVKHQKTS